MKHNNSTSSWTRIAASLGILALSGLAACEGPGFLPPGEGDDEPVITLMEMSPDPLTEGDTLRVNVEASGVRPLTRARFQFRGAAIKDTTIAVPEAARQIEVEFTIPVLFGTGPDSLLYLDLIVIDAADIESEIAEDTVFIIDATPPSVAADASPSQVGSGEPLEITVTAEDARGLASVGYLVIDQATGDTVESFVEQLEGNPFQYEAAFTVTAPELNPTTLQVTAFAEDRNGLVGRSDTAAVGLEDRQGPDLQILETFPDSTIPLEDSIEVRIQAVDPSGIRRLTFIGLAARGDTLLGTDTVVVRFDQVVIPFPRPGEDTLPETLIRAPRLGTPDDSTSEPITLVVVAEDGFGNLTEVTRNMYVGGPNVSLVYPTTDIELGVSSTFEARVRISDRDGIDSAKVFLSGAVNQVIDLPLPARTDTTFTTAGTVNLPATEGVVTLVARAWNLADVAGLSREVQISVLEDAPTDFLAPVVSVEAEILVPESSKPRMELKDILRITVSAFDEGSAGLERLGFKAVASRAGAQHVISESTTFGGVNGLQEHEFAVPLDSLYELLGITSLAEMEAVLPDEIDLRIHAFAADTAGNLACSTGIEEQRACDPPTYTAAGTYEAADTAGLLLEITGVRGHTVLLDNRDALIADLALDTIDNRLFLSNITQNLVEVLDLHPDPDLMAFLDPVQVGAQPWGLFIGDRIVNADDNGFSGATVGDTVRTLIVGNSGGTNMSLVHLDADAANVQEVDVVRLRTPNAVLHEITIDEDEVGNKSYLQRSPPYDFSDRPQFLAQDSLLRIVYSTVPTLAENTSTIRYVHVDPDPTSSSDVPEVRFLLTADMVSTDSDDKLALANIDSIQVQGFTTSDDLVKVFTHEPGYPNNVIVNVNWEPEFIDAVLDVTGQIDAVMTARGQGAQAPLFYPFFAVGQWAIDRIGMSDTTFISASTNRGRIAIGEGAAQPTGRIILWEANPLFDLSSNIEIVDLIHNAAERVLGVGLNWDGSMGVARGQDATYFFTPDLRLQGLYLQEQQGGAGATFHPDHNDVSDGGHTDTELAGAAFTGTPSRSIEVVNTFHFNQITELAIRDNVIGPLRAGPPLASDNNGEGRACTAGDDCIVAKLYGITDAGGVVIVNIRKSDLANP